MMTKGIFALLICIALAGCAAHYNSQGMSSIKSGNYSSAMKSFEKAALEGNADALSNIGYMYHYGKGVPRNLTTAQKYYKAALDKGSIWGLNNLGILYVHHGENQSDKDLGFQYLTLAARWGNPSAINSLKKHNRPVPPPDLYYKKEISEIVAIFGLVGLANSTSSINSPPPSSYKSTSRTPSVKPSSSCLSDNECGFGGKCVKEIADFEGVCMTMVDKYGTPSVKTPSGGIGIRSLGSEQCRFDTECPLNFSCSEQYRVCVKD